MASSPRRAVGSSPGLGACGGFRAGHPHRSDRGHADPDGWYRNRRPGDRGLARTQNAGRATKTLFRRRQQAGQFAEDWFKASKEIAPDEEQRAAARAQAWLDEASELVAESKPPPPSEEKRSVTVRRLLLAYPMHRRSARVLRGFYYFFLGMVVFQVSGALGCRIRQDGHDRCPQLLLRRVDLRRPPRHLHVHVIAMGFRFWSLRAEESQSARFARQRMTLRSALLLYRFNGIRAHIARIVYWIWLALDRAGHRRDRDKRRRGPDARCPPTSSCSSPGSDGRRHALLGAYHTANAPPASRATA